MSRGGKSNDSQSPATPGRLVFQYRLHIRPGHDILRMGGSLEEHLLGRVDCFSIAGLDIYFNSSDHGPPHFHVESTDWQIRVFIDTSSKEKGLDFEYKDPRHPPKNFRGITKKQRQSLLDLLISHRAELLKEWQAKVDVKENI